MTVTGRVGPPVVLRSRGRPLVVHGGGRGSYSASPNRGQAPAPGGTSAGPGHRTRPESITTEPFAEAEEQRPAGHEAVAQTPRALLRGEDGDQERVVRVAA
jgi:hypothetical protein